MTHIRTVRLELLRHGDADSHLLSRLTPYLALCEDHPAHTIYSPIGHRELLRALHRIRSPAAGASAADLDALVEPLTQMLRGVPELESELAARTPRELVELELVLAGHELSTLPLEAAIAPLGVGDVDRRNVAATTRRLVITRSARRRAHRPSYWFETPRILFVAVAAPDLPAVDTKAHLLALRSALAPWTDGRDLGEYLTVIKPEPGETRSTLARISSALREAERPYTHVHVLAHGVEHTPDGQLPEFRIAMSGEPDRVDHVSGGRLAAVLHAHESPTQTEPPCPPCMVTLAVCDGGANASVLAPAGNIAHELHAVGVPCVIASQFPLSALAAVRMTESVYRQVLKGADPRQAICNMRGDLFALSDSAQQEASNLISYGRYPSDLDEWLDRTRLELARRAMKLTHAALQPDFSHPVRAAAQTAGLRESDGTPEMFDPQRAHAVVEAAVKACQVVVDVAPTGHRRFVTADTIARQGAMKKRLAVRTILDEPSADASASGERFRRLCERFEDALTHYRDAEHIIRDAMRPTERDYARLDWVVTQSLFLRRVMGQKLDALRDDIETARTAAVWVIRLWRGSRHEAWARGTLAELALLENKYEEVDNQIDKLIALSVPDYPAVIASTFTQLGLYAYDLPDLLEGAKSTHPLRVADAVDRIANCAKICVERLRGHL